MENKIKPELLSPAGDFSKLKYALAYGADAVYAGIPKFSLRTRENDFREKTLVEAIDYTHKRGKKIYLTMNIFAHNNKIDSFIHQLEKAAEWNPDGLIMADPGLISLALKRFPKIPIHLSTQANASNWTTVKFWHELGVSRIILARELSLKEIAEIHEKVPGVELEAFVHGAICISYSGRCLISNYLNHRDANQGTCTNSCRWDYKLSKEFTGIRKMEEQQISKFEEGLTQSLPDNFYVEEPQRTGEKFPVSEDEHGTYLFNAKDLCSVELLEELSEAGIISFKIEGRTKSAYYAAMSTRAYRGAIDDLKLNNNFNIEILDDLIALSNRSYTTGFYSRNPREFGENYYDSRSRETTNRAVGMDLKYDQLKGLLSFEVKNRLEKGTEVEIITPDTKKIIIIDQIINEKNQSVDIAHGGAGRCSIPLGWDPGEFAVMRRQLYKREREIALTWNLR